MKCISAFILSIFIFGIGSSLADDSIPDLMLDDVVVKADRGWIKDGIINVIPTKSEKKLSNSPATLIGSMNLPFLREKEGAIVNPAGQAVAVFINGERANDIDLATFYSMNVKRVQYIEHPADPRFEGVEAAVNFIMPVYEYGGVTRANVMQKFVQTYGNGEIASKLVYRKMTYGLMLSGNYSRDKANKATGTTRYRDLYYDGEYYDEISYTDESVSRSKHNYASLSFNAKYSTDKTQITHTISLLREAKPESVTESYGAWSQDLFGASNTLSSSTSKTLSPQISGAYMFTLPRRWYLYGTWLYTYARNDASSLSQFGSTSPIVNMTKEDVNSCRLVIFPSFIPSEKLGFNLLLDGSADFYSTRYKGSADTRQHISRKNLTSQLRVTWYPTAKFSVRFEPGFDLTIRDIGAISRHDFNPNITGSLNWNPGRKFNLSGSLRYYLRSASSGETNPVMVKHSELLWSLGNPFLKDVSSWDAGTYFSYLPCNELSTSFNLHYSRINDQIYSDYSAASIEQGGLIRENLNCTPENVINASLSLSGNLLNGKLSLNLRPTIFYIFYSEPLLTRSHTHFSISGDASYTLGNVRFQAAYESPYSGISLGGLAYSWRQDYFNFSVTYGSGNLYLSARAEDIFHHKEKRINRFASPHYTTDYTAFNPGRRFSINVTYTFDYGRKVDRSIDISGPSSAKTSVASY